MPALLTGRQATRSGTGSGPAGSLYTGAAYRRDIACWFAFRDPPGVPVGAAGLARSMIARMLAAAAPSFTPHGWPGDVVDRSLDPERPCGPHDSPGEAIEQRPAPQRRLRSCSATSAAWRLLAGTSMRVSELCNADAHPGEAGGRDRAGPQHILIPSRA